MRFTWRRICSLPKLLILTRECTVPIGLIHSPWLGCHTSPGRLLGPPQPTLYVLSDTHRRSVVKVAYLSCRLKHTAGSTSGNVSDRSVDSRRDARWGDAKAHRETETVEEEWISRLWRKSCKVAMVRWSRGGWKSEFVETAMIISFVRTRLSLLHGLVAPNHIQSVVLGLGWQKLPFEAKVQKLCYYWTYTHWNYLARVMSWGVLEKGSWKMKWSWRLFKRIKSQKVFMSHQRL